MRTESRAGNLGLRIGRLPVGALQASLQISIITALFTLQSTDAFAKGGGGAYAPILSTGVHFFAGEAGKSATGTMGYVVDLQAEKRQGLIRPTIAGEVQFASGTASIGTESPTFTMYGGGFLGGVNVFPFTEGRFQPFFGAQGIYSWNQLKLASPPTGVEANTQTMAFGYQLTAGADLRLGSVEGNAIRIQTSLWSVTGTLAGVSGFQLTGFRFSLGLVF